MKAIEQTVSVRSSKRCQMIDITSQIVDIVVKNGILDGLITIYCPHTTAAITINENADPDVPHDILLTLDKLIPQHLSGYQHNEGNSDAHVKSSLFGCSRQIILKNGTLVLGTWQGLFFCEFDGPRSRTVHVQILGQ
jgi:secondary thiamine-phosphate synthase enzyme